VSPTNDGVRLHYIAEVDWDLLGADSTLDSRRQLLDWRLEMVAGAAMYRKHPPPYVPLRINIGT